MLGLSSLTGCGASPSASADLTPGAGVGNVHEHEAHRDVVEGPAGTPSPVNPREHLAHPATDESRAADRVGGMRVR